MTLARPSNSFDKAASPCECGPPSEFCQAVLNGLSQAQKQLSPKYFYDEQGSRYFDEICDLDEYYLTRTEMALLPQVARDLAEIVQKPIALVEFGAGSLLKVRPLLAHCRQIREFFPIDISAEHLRDACQDLSQHFPEVTITPLAADFTRPLVLPEAEGQRMGFFPGSTIGNFEPQQAQAFLQNALEILGSNAYFLIGVDTKKSTSVLHRAYNDARGVTAKFNMNMLERINRELNADFQIQDFEHYAYFNIARACVEMHLVSRKEQSVNIKGHDFDFCAGESIHTESSFKYWPKEFRALAAQAGWQVQQQWLAERDAFAVYLLKAPAI